MPTVYRGPATVYRGPATVDNLATPRAASEEEDAAVPEFRQRNKTDAEVWQDMLDKHPILAEAAAHWERMKAALGFTARSAYDSLESGRQQVAQRRDFSRLADL